MIGGIGIDVIEIERVRKAYHRWGKSFLRKVFTDSEIEYCLSKHDPAPSLATRFAAREAGFKALSQAGVKIHGWKDLWVETDGAGRPKLRIIKPVGYKLNLSLSHTKDNAIAIVVAETDSHRT